MLPGVQAPGAHAEVFVREQRTIRVKNANNEPKHLYGTDETSDVEEEMTQFAITQRRNNEDVPDGLGMSIFQKFTLALSTLWKFNYRGILDRVISGGRNGEQAFPLLILVIFILLLVAFLIPFLPVMSQSPPPPPPPLAVVNQTNATVTPAVLPCESVQKCFKENLSEESVKRLILTELSHLGLLGDDHKLVSHLFSPQKKLDDEELKKEIRALVAENFAGRRNDMESELKTEMKKQLEKATSDLKARLLVDVDTGKASELEQKLTEIIEKEKAAIKEDLLKEIEAKVDVRMGQLESAVSSVEKNQLESKGETEKVRLLVKEEVQSLGNDSRRIIGDLEAKQRGYVDEKLAQAETGHRKHFSDELTQFEEKLKSEWEKVTQATTESIKAEAIEEVEAKLASRHDKAGGLTKKEVLALIIDEMSKWKEEMSDDLSQMNAEKDAQLRSDIMSKVTSISGSDLAEFKAAEIEKLVRNEIGTALHRFLAADKTGKADYALRSAGGCVIKRRHSATYDNGASYFSFYGVRLWNIVNSPETAIEPGVLPGQCWPFVGSEGFLVIKLFAAIYVTEISYEHVERNLTENGTITSAPKGISVQGMADETDSVGTPLGSFLYDKEGPPLQTFPTEADVRDRQPFRFVQFNVDSNHGHMDYTCLYRIRIHGRRADI
ncbi:klaroid protein-like [Oscarella lobularis]|uniref:klaroid protein-like n=1 Tax=Oscarella lobularis TaxID=121494 RepID=UPI00331351BC